MRASCGTRSQGLAMRRFFQNMPDSDDEATPVERPPMPVTRSYLDGIALELSHEGKRLTRNVEALLPFAVAMKWVPILVVGTLLLGAAQIVLLAVLVFGHAK